MKPAQDAHNGCCLHTQTSHRGHLSFLTLGEGHGCLAGAGETLSAVGAAGDGSGQETAEDAVPASARGGRPGRSRGRRWRQPEAQTCSDVAVPDRGEGEGAPPDEELRRPAKRGGLARVTGFQDIVDLGKHRAWL